jgi:hypothetical protein
MSYKFKFDPESSKNEDSKESKALILRTEDGNFWEKFLDMLPTPEEEIETMIKDEKKLEESIEEIKEVLKKIEEALESFDSLDLKEDLEKKKFYYISLLEEFETELQCIKVQHKSMEIVLKDSDDEEELNIPELIANSMISTKKKMEDVNDVVKSIEKISKKNRIEECIQCEKIVKDECGRKASIMHIHFNDKSLEMFKKYKPVICLDCFNNFYSEFIDINSIKDSEIDSETVCKKGSKIYSKELYETLPEFKDKIKKFINLEKEEFINNIKEEDKKDIFNFLKY